jgi:hypothetical protein
MHDFFSVNDFFVIILADERRVESPRKLVIEEPIKPFVPHTFEQVTQLSRDALKILFDQNTDFSNRENIRAKIPNSYFTSNQQGISFILLYIYIFLFLINRFR